jgi:hypothetical protein
VHRLHVIVYIRGHVTRERIQRHEMRLVSYPPTPPFALSLFLTNVSRRPFRLFISQRTTQEQQIVVSPFQP